MNLKNTVTFNIQDNFMSYSVNLLLRKRLFPSSEPAGAGD
jgi:hypothetical protein